MAPFVRSLASGEVGVGVQVMSYVFSLVSYPSDVAVVEGAFYVAHEAVQPSVTLLGPFGQEA